METGIVKRVEEVFAEIESKKVQKYVTGTHRYYIFLEDREKPLIVHHNWFIDNPMLEEGELIGFEISKHPPFHDLEGEWVSHLRRARKGGEEKE